MNIEGIDLIELRSGESLCSRISEITKIPDMTILESKTADISTTEAEYRKEIGSLLTELFQNYLSFLETDRNSEICFELLFLTEAVNNQPFAARIRLFFIVRSLSRKKDIAEKQISQIDSVCNSFFRSHKYSTNQVSLESVTNLLKEIPRDNIGMLVRDERIDNLQNQLLPQCYAFDRFDGFSPDLSSLISCLIEHPDNAVSFSLIPTRYSNEEMASLMQVSQILENLSRGIMTQGYGNVNYSSAETLSQTYNYYSRNRNNALFYFNVMVWGKTTEVSEIMSKVRGVMTYDPSKSIALKTVHLNQSNISIPENYFALPWVANEIAVQLEHDQSVMMSQNVFGSMFRLRLIITAEEASGFFRLPIGTAKVNAGLNVNYSDTSRKTYSDNLINADNIEIGILKASGQDTIGISRDDLTKHMLIVGTPGSGKTTFSVSLLDRLWKEQHIPFLVIEPAKNEYRAMIGSIPELQVFTPGKNFISPFVFNPFIPPKNVRLETYKSTLKTAFEAGVSMRSPLDKIFEEAIRNCYSDYMWLDSYTSDNKGKVFNISDFIRCFQKTVDNIGYTGDAKNIGRAGVVRLSSLVNLFDNYHSIPVEDLLSKPTVIELAAIENSDQKALIISLLLLSILAYVNSNYPGDGKLKNIILLEEAHVLLSSISESEDANPSAIAQNLLKRMLAEIRSYGVGIAIADQSPRKVTSDVVALTDVKLAFRLVEAQDKQIIADSMNMEEVQMKRLGRLKPGEAFLFFNKLEEPEEVAIADYRAQKDISITITDQKIKQLSSYWHGKEQMLKPYPECNYINACSNTCNYDRRILGREIARRIYVKYCRPSMNSIDQIKPVFQNMTKLVYAELNGEEFSKELLLCTKCQLFRRIRYGTKVPIHDSLIKNTLSK
ncbi:MAG: ATP-binding protein [Erysipelotrichaceae bacterium]|nr:ATP-binding protein [Erysipelotrichaceae bacterium]